MYTTKENPRCVCQVGGINLLNALFCAARAATIENIENGEENGTVTTPAQFSQIPSSS